MNKILAICITLVTLGVLIGTSAAPAGEHDVDNITLRCPLGEHQCWYALGGCKGVRLTTQHDDSGLVQAVSFPSLGMPIKCKWYYAFGSGATHMRAFPSRPMQLADCMHGADCQEIIPSEWVLLHIYLRQTTSNSVSRFWYPEIYDLMTEQ